MPSDTIGKHNPRLGEVRRALRQGGLTADGLLPIEGAHLLEEATKSGVEIVELFAEAGGAARFKSSCHYTVAPSVIQSISATRKAQGPIALVRPPIHTLESMLRGDCRLLIVLCGLQDPGNVGSILRVGEAFGADGCVTTEGSVSLYNDKVVRGSAGSLFRLPHVGHVNLGQLVDRLRAGRIDVVGTDAASPDTVDRMDWLRPTALLLGNEGAGLNQQERKACDRIIGIPHAVALDSLNAAAAAAILLYAAARCRRTRV